MAVFTSFLLLGMLAARGHGQTYSATYLPSDAPDHTQDGQYGTNQCGTQSSQDSLCQNAYRELQRAHFPTLYSPLLSELGGRLLSLRPSVLWFECNDRRHRTRRGILVSQGRLRDSLDSRRYYHWGALHSNPGLHPDYRRRRLDEAEHTRGRFRWRAGPSRCGWKR